MKEHNLSEGNNQIFLFRWGSVHMDASSKNDGVAMQFSFDRKNVSELYLS